jgi:hypothetical protein
MMGTTDPNDDPPIPPQRPDHVPRVHGAPEITVQSKGCISKRPVSEQVSGSRYSRPNGAQHHSNAEWCGIASAPMAVPPPHLLMAGFAPQRLGDVTGPKDTDGGSYLVEGQANQGDVQSPLSRRERGPGGEDRARIRQPRGRLSVVVPGRKRGMKPRPDHRPLHAAAGRVAASRRGRGRGRLTAATCRADRPDPWRNAGSRA